MPQTKGKFKKGKDRNGLAKQIIFVVSFIGKITACVKIQISKKSIMKKLIKHFQCIIFNKLHT
jgi:hypothetical protein